MTTIKPGVELAARAAVASRTQALFHRHGAIDDDHVLLDDGRHRTMSLRELRVLASPEATTELCGYLAAAHRDDAGPSRVDAVVGIVPAGVILAAETARQLGARTLVAEPVRRPDGTVALVVDRGVRVGPGERVLLVDGVVASGGTLRRAIDGIEEAGGELVECAVLVDQGGRSAVLTSPRTGRVYPLRALWTVELPAAEPGAERCPACAEGTPLRAMDAGTAA